jgi:hypothetical protein
MEQLSIAAIILILVAFVIFFMATIYAVYSAGFFWKKSNKLKNWKRLVVSIIAFLMLLTLSGVFFYSPGVIEWGGKLVFIVLLFGFSSAIIASIEFFNIWYCCLTPLQKVSINNKFGDWLKRKCYYAKLQWKTDNDQLKKDYLASQKEG